MLYTLNEQAVTALQLTTADVIENGTNYYRMATLDTAIRGHKKEAIDLLLKDQYPISTDKEITIELTDNGKAKVNTETGILTWDTKLNAGETKKYRISYKVKYPKDKIISNL